MPGKPSQPDANCDSCAFSHPDFLSLDSLNVIEVLQKIIEFFRQTDARRLQVIPLSKSAVRKFVTKSLNILPQSLNDDLVRACYIVLSNEN
jgi:hypothetical protein